ncbi:hypothetical protein B0H17DRAFT_1215836 [Mycena rosella]|uniref:Uncharacterized protein n=1 Tax=Mycena rosella TaxID=1033263 RepID=A0AAD7CDT6_MYCRO|nr:hypothetical protein B0H17DRAFT_1215836 [Mycena rosella]
MRPPNSDAGPSGKKEKNLLKGKSKAADTQAAVENTNFKAIGIAVIPDGVILDEQVLTPVQGKVPDRTTIQMLVGQGLAVLNQNGFDLCRTWTHSQLADFFFSVLPNVFGYFKDLEADNPGSAQWLLGVASRFTLKVVPVPRPTGFDVEYNTVQSRTSFRNVQILILARHPIPVRVYSAWIDSEFLSFTGENDPVDNDGKI